MNDSRYEQIGEYLSLVDIVSADVVAFTGLSPKSISLRFTSPHTAGKFVANLLNILDYRIGDAVCPAKLRGSTVEILFLESKFQIEQLHQANELARNILTVHFLSNPEQIFERNIAFSFTRRGSNLFLYSGEREESNITNLLDTSENLYSSVENPTIRARFEVRAQTIIQVRDMLAFLYKKGAVLSSFVDTQLPLIQNRMRAQMCMQKLIMECSQLGYFNDGSITVKHHNRDTMHNSSYYAIETPTHSQALLTSNFLLNELMMDVPDSVYETRSGAAIDIDDSVIDSNLHFLETLPLHYENFHEAISTLKSIKGITRLKLTNGKLRVRCDKQTLIKLSRLDSSYIPPVRTPLEMRTYSNRIFLDPYILYSEIHKLNEIAGSTENIKPSKITRAG